MATAAPPVASANKAELLAIADAVAREKLIDRGIVIEAMEDAIQRAARARYGAENDIRAKLDGETGDLRLWRVLEVVEEPEDHFKQIDPKGAQKLQKGAAVGDFIVDPLPPIEFGRIAAQAVHSLGRECHEVATAQQFCGVRNCLGAGSRDAHAKLSTRKRPLR